MSAPVRSRRGPDGPGETVDPPAPEVLGRTTTRPARLPVVDAARAAALVAMAAYHFVWDLGYLRLTPENWALTPPGRAAAHGIAGSFLLLVGLGLVLMNGGGLRPRPILLRLARIGGAAVLITAATAVAFPESYIFFGVLHCIAVASVLGLPFLFLPVAVAALAAVLVLAAPWFVHAPVLDAPWLLFLGLGAREPVTNDYVPLFPWFGMVLAGICVGRLGLAALARSRLGAWRPRGRLGRAATFAGRHSLAVYLVHQPVLLGLLSGLAALTGPHPRAGLADFRADYRAVCTRTGGQASACRIAARCTSDALRREGLWTPGADGFAPTERLRAQGLSQACYTAAEGATPPAPP